MRAEEDELDDVVDIEGEDSQVVGDDALGDDDDSAVKSSQDVETTILFTKPITSLGDNVFGEIYLIILLYKQPKKLSSSFGFKDG